MSDWPMCDHVTLPKFNMAAKLRSLFIPVERTLTVAYELCIIHGIRFPPCLLPVWTCIGDHSKKGHLKEQPLFIA